MAFEFPGCFPTDPHEDDGAIKEARHESGECVGVKGGCWYCIDEDAGRKSGKLGAQ